MTRPTGRQERHGERGSVTAEIVLITPVVLMLLMLLIAGWRITNASFLVEAAARDAARAASLSHTAASAPTAAQTAAHATLTGQHLPCRIPEVTTNLGEFRPGGWVTVQVACQVPLTDLALLPLPGALATQAQAAHPVDLYRSVQP